MTSPKDEDTINAVLFELHGRNEILSDEAGVLMKRLREFVPDDEKFWSLACRVIQDDDFRGLMVEMTIKRPPPNTVEELLEHFSSMDGVGRGNDFVEAANRHRIEFG